MNSSPQDLIYWLAASHLLGVSLQKLIAWLKRLGNYQSLFVATATELKEAGFTAAEIKKIKNIYWPSIEAEQQWYAEQGTVLTLHDARYPALLKEIADPPLVLYVAGDSSLLSLPQLGIVGSRQPSAWGGALAKQFAEALVAKGLVITSGLATGIDSACHQGALAAGGKTIAVIGTGLRQTYPRSHEALAEKIRQQGAVVSEFPLNTPPAAWHFPRRNRIISGLSLGVLVVEAALQSGSLITARLAMEQNREVFAIPGSIHHGLARGCHQLIRQGAKLVETAEDIVEELAALAAFVKTTAPAVGVSQPLNDLTTQETIFLEQLAYAVVAFDTVMLQSGLTAIEVSSMLLSLELKGYVEVVQGGYLRRR